MIKVYLRRRINMMMQRTHTSQSFRRWLSPNSINRWKQTNSYERRFFSEKTTQEAPKVTKEALIHEGKAIIKLFVSGTALMTALAISSGFVIETTKSYNPPTPPGQVLQIDGAQGKVSIHVQKRGNGPLTVLLDGGVGETSFDWNKVSKSIESFATVVSIDRPGTGFSSPGDLPRTSSQIVKEYKDILNRLDVSGDVILVAHGAGGYNMRELAAELESSSNDTDAKCRGLVLIDALQENLHEELRNISDPVKNCLNDQVENGKLVLNLSRIGLIRLINYVQHKKNVERYSPELFSFVEYYLPTPAHRQGVVFENEGLVLTEKHFREKPPSKLSKHVPCVVVSHGLKNMFDALKFQPGIQPSMLNEMEIKWEEAQKWLVKNTTQGKTVHYIVPQSGHNIQYEQPAEIMSIVLALVNEIEKPGGTEGLESLRTGKCEILGSRLSFNHN